MFNHALSSSDLEDSNFELSLNTGLIHQIDVINAY